MKNVLFNGMFTCKALGCLKKEDLDCLGEVYAFDYPEHATAGFRSLCSERAITLLQGWTKPLELQDPGFKLSDAEIRFIYDKMAFSQMPLYRFKFSDNLFFSQVVVLQNFAFWLTFLRSRRIHYIISDKPVYLDTPMHYAAKYLGIPIFTFFPMARQPDNSSLFYTFDEQKKRPIPIGTGDVDVIKIVFPLKQPKTTNRRSILGNSVLRQFARALLTGQIRETFFVLNEVWEYHRLRRTVRNLYSRAPVDANVNYIYYALHFDPEMNTMPYEEMYANQLLNILIISASLPPGWVLYVKDHPHQHDLVRMSYTVERYLVDLKYYRDKYFYSYIASLDNVRFLDHSTNQDRIIEHARAVASINGTVFAEASHLSKPILVFGHKSPYRRLSNAFGVSDVASCKMAIDKIVRSDGCFHSDIDEFLRENTILANIHQPNEKDRLDIAQFFRRLFQYISTMDVD